MNRQSDTADAADTTIDVKSALDGFKTSVLERVTALENEQRELGADVKRFTLDGQRPDSMKGDDSATRAALDGAMRDLLRGDDRRWLGEFASKGMNAGTDPEGGFAVIPQFSTEMTKVMAEISPMQRLAREVNLDSGTTFHEIVDRDGADGVWVGEADPRNETTAPAIKMFTCEVAELSAMPKATQKMIDGASFDIVAWLQAKIAETFALKESAAFHSGDGINKPRGFLTYATAATPDATRAWGTIEHVATGASGAFPTSSSSVNPADVLIDLQSALKAQYRRGAVWLMNRQTAGAVRKLKDADGRHVWADSLVVGQPAVLLGHPVEISEDMPSIAAGSLSIAFGDFKRAYTIVRRLGIRFLTDPYSDKPNVRLYAYARVSGGVNNSEAIKLLKFA